MTTTAGAKRLIEAKYEAEEIEENVYKLVFDIDGTRSQVVFVEVNDGFLLIRSPFANIDDVSPKRALDANSNTQLGLQLKFGVYYITHMVPLDDLDKSELDVGLGAVAAVADICESALSKGDVY